MALLEEIFKKSGLPTYTFVQPAEYNNVLVAIRTPGKGVIIEGPSGIGKTTCIKSVLADLNATKSALFLSARKPSDIALISALPEMKDIGIVVVDDFHKLETSIQQSLTDFLKFLADEEVPDSKLVLIGINRAGQALIDFAPDLLNRIETIRLGRTNVERLIEMISLGETALNCSISVKHEIAEEANGSFGIAQTLAHEACLRAGLKATSTETNPAQINSSLPSIREALLEELKPRFFGPSRDFATGSKLRREGRAPYLHLLLWLSQTNDGVLDTREAMAQHPEVRGSVSQVIDKGYLSEIIRTRPDIEALLHFDARSGFLAAEDPKFLYFCNNLIWPKFARQVGYFSVAFKHKYDFALSFAGEDRQLAESLCNELVENEVAVFYDKNEQQRILANDVEEYLAPIYRSESRFVLPLLSRHYPKKIWTKFESIQFKDRFGDRGVIPIWFNDNEPGIFDESRRVGGLPFDVNGDLSAQAKSIAHILRKKLEEERQDDKTQETPDLFSAVATYGERVKG
jgi:hypothetical protein